MLGVNVSALLLPAGVAAVIACRDLLTSFASGFFLMMVQPFRWGRRGERDASMVDWHELGLGGMWAGTLGRADGAF